jgi:hypothetical protein
VSGELAAALIAGDADAACYKLRDFGNALAIVDSRPPPEKSIVWAGPASDRALAEKELASVRMRARLAAVTAAAKAHIQSHKDKEKCEGGRPLRYDDREKERAMSQFLAITP